MDGRFSWARSRRVLANPMTNDNSLLALVDHMLWVTALVAAPALLACLAVGLVVGLVQAATSVNEQTLTFVPKLIIVSAILVIFGASMMALVSDFTHDIFEEIARVGQ